MIRLRWFNFDVSRDRKNNPITVVDRILEIAAGMMAVGMLVLTSVLYVQAPDTVPSHFNAMGEANGWSDKSIYWIMAAVFVVSMIISASAAYNRRKYLQQDFFVYQKQVHPKVPSQRWICRCRWRR